MAISGIILAGGKSRRLGMDKAFLRFRGQALIQHALGVMRALSDDVMVVANDQESYQHLGARLVGDVYPNGASLGGIYAGLLAARHPQGLVVGCDMPFLSLALLRYMISLAKAHDVVMPRYGTYLEPLHAIYHVNCLPKMRELIEAGQLRISEVFCNLPTRFVTEGEIALFDPDKLSFFNINTPEDLERAETLASFQDQGRESRRAAGSKKP